jgi:hypothetical protein
MSGAGSGACALGKLCIAGGGLHRALQDRIVQVVPTPLAGQAVMVDASGGEDPLPDPLAPSVRVLPEQGGRQLHPTGPRG